MSDDPVPPPFRDTSRNLLFGLLALQNNFISRDVLVAAFGAWLADKSRPLDRVLLDQGHLDADCLVLLTGLVRQHLKLHGDDPEKSLADFSSIGSVIRRLMGLGDADLSTSLGHVAAAPRGDQDFDPDATSSFLGAPTSSGGRFQVLRLHAQGGLGEVYVARDEEVHREVALKQMKGEHAYDLESRARFLVEAEITGGLEHPGIVPVYGLGTYDDGRPFYAMRFIRGDSLKGSLARFHADQDLQADPGRRTLALQKLLRRFLDVCNAIGYAHSRGVLHRDLKPGNIMLGDYGETLVVDWGLAKAVGRHLEPPAPTGAEPTLRPASGSDAQPTLMGSRLGTPAYMPPEQAAGRLDELGAPSDVYSLGATLYVLLTGRAPFTEPDLPTLLRQVEQGEFPRPREIHSWIAPALEAVCLKAMARRPQDRYPSPRVLADDIEHWLADEPVDAYSEPLTARAARWARRHRTSVVAATVLLLSAVVALSIGSVLVTLERNEARQQGRFARGAVEDMYTQVAEKWLADQPQMGAIQRQFLEKALSYYEGFTRMASTDPEVRREKGKAYQRMGDMLRKLGRHNEAERAYRSALDLLDRLAREAPADPGYRHDLAHTYSRLGIVLMTTGRHAEAEAAYRSAMGIQEALEAADPGRPEYRYRLAMTQKNLADLLQAGGKHAEAETAYQHTLDLLGRLVREAPDEATYHQDLAITRLSLGSLLEGIGQYAKAEEVVRLAVETFEKLVAEAPTLPGRREDLAHARTNLGLLLFASGRIREAEDSLKLALNHYDTLARDFSDRPDYRTRVAGTQTNLGVLFWFDNRRSEAEAAYRSAVNAYDKLVGEFHDSPQYQVELSRCLGNLGTLLTIDNRRSEAEEVFLRAVQIQEKLANASPGVPSYRKDLASALSNLGLLQAAAGRPSESEATSLRALKLFEALEDEFPEVPEYHRDVANCLVNLGDLRRPGAEANYRRARVIYAALISETPAIPSYRDEMALCQLGLGDLLAIQGHMAEAETVFREAVDLCRKLSAEFPDNLDYRGRLGRALGALGAVRLARSEPAEACQFLEQAAKELRVVQKARPGQSDDSRYLREADASLARAFLALGRTNEAAEVADELSRVAPDRVAGCVEAARLLARCAVQAGRDRGRPFADRALTRLREAITAGLTDIDRLGDDPDFMPLRGRFDELEEQAKPRAKSQ